MRQFLAAAALVAVVSGCSSPTSSTSPTPVAPSVQHRTIPQAVHPEAATSAVTNPGFETGSLSPWAGCGGVSDQAISTAQAHTGTYSALIGKTTKPEVNGFAGICQTVTVPANATLSFYVYEGTNDTVQYADQEADLYDTSGNLITNLYTEAKSTGGWVLKSFNVGSYGGQTVQLFFGIYGNGYSGDYLYQYVDDVAFTVAGATAAPTVAPTVKPTTAPTTGPTTAPTTKPTTAPTTKPTTAPTAMPSAPVVCNNTQFTNDQNAFAAGTITADQPENVCGYVTQVLAEKKTASGNHGYFYVALPSGYDIEIVSNLDAMAEASTSKPPTTWPWVAVNQYTYVRGRYYYDSSSSQGIDWTEDDTSSSWSQLGYVYVCDTNAANCVKYW